MTDMTTKPSNLIADKFTDAETPGYESEFSPDEAAQAGAFVEDALSEADAKDSAIDAEGVGAATDTEE